MISCIFKQIIAVNGKLNQFKGKIGKNEANFELSLLGRAMYIQSKLRKRADPLRKCVFVNLICMLY